MARSARVAAVVTCALAAAASLAGDALGQATKPATGSPPAAVPPAAVPIPALGNASVSVPWPELSALLDRAREAPAKPPVDYVFAAATYTGTVTGDSARVAADLDVTLLRDGFVLVPLGPADGGVESATVDGQPAALVPQGGQLNALLT
ncbi:MAG TPA: hypothetical protein VF796_14545, partial [Humisphaera sp.]